MIHYISTRTYFQREQRIFLLFFLNIFFLFAAKEPPVQVTGEDTDAVHRRFVKEPAANIKDGVTEPSKVSISPIWTDE